MNFELDELPAAHRDVDGIFLLIAKDSIAAAIRFHEAVDTSYDALRETPLAGRVYESRYPELKGVRKLTIRYFNNFIIFYTVGEGVVTILRVLNGAQDVSRVLLESDSDE